jgi:AraC family transcriptional regulator
LVLPPERCRVTIVDSIVPNHPPSSDLLSRQVSGSRYFFLNLAPVRRKGHSLALGGREHCNPDYVIRREHYDYHVLEYVASGRGDVTLDGVRHALGPGSIFAYAPATQCEMRTDPEDPMVKYFLCIAGNRARLLLTRAAVPPGQARRLAAHAELTGLFEDLIREGQHAGSRTREICAALLELLVLKISVAAEKGRNLVDAGRGSFLRCKALIDARAEEFVSLREIANAARLDTSSVCRLFRQFQGTSPYQYLLRRKMNLAAEILIDQGCLVKEAALRVGFADPFHFSRCFKAVHGVAPRELQRQIREAPFGAD